MFSKAVISEEEIFDEEIDMLLEYFRGEVKNVIDASCVGSGESGEEGSIKIADFQSVVTTTEDKYVLTTRYYISDTVTRDRVGIYSLLQNIVKKIHRIFYYLSKETCVNFV